MQNIDMTTIVLSTVLISAFIAPFAYYSFKNNKTEKALSNTFLDFAKSYGINPTVVERWRNHYTIGLDKTAQKLVYFSYGDFPQQVIINLDEVNKVSLQEKFRTVTVGNEKRNILEFLALQFHFKDPQHLARTVEVYDGNLFTDQMGERVIAKKWLEVLSKELKAA
jgi:hypothetical protein